MKYDCLHLVTLDQQGHDKTCNYWYLVQSFGATPHTAFTRREALARWLNERNIELTEPLPDHGQHSSQRLSGSYSQQAHMNPADFFALRGPQSRALSNGDYTLAVITRDGGNHRTVHTLNPNVRDRPVYDYQSTRAVYC